MPFTVGLMLATVADLDSGRLDTERVVDAARRAEAAGFDAVYVGDHLLHPHPMLESIVTLSVVAASTTRVTLGPCVLLAALRRPLVLARQLGTLAAFAPGRVRVGVGVGGEYPAEFDAAGVPLAARGRRMEATVREVQSLLSTASLPFVFGGWHESALRRAAAHGDGWIGYLLSPDGFATRRAFLLERTGDRPFTTGMLLPVHVGAGASDASAAWTRLTRKTIPETHFLAGAADDVAAQVMRYAQAGCDEVVLAAADQGHGYLSQVELLAADVLPRLQGRNE